ncbi:GGDEF domain-containing protein [Azomonas macrocytogenes]|uniref:diguanylate cyclase n=1 Tax=Azomonas macrocytogenes TaxID=69962 RepID=A0A839T542_AZOMA|nr:GGDEF domain-containing protein [Azomonas macrocytogenes]MBB3103606.1 diguanylate cyclase (GGDEF)-like protein [Azomonas macrocytogenes]
MQKLPPISNIIDFDTSRLPQLEVTRQRNQVQPVKNNIADLHRQLVLQLQTSLEADRLLSMFFDTVRGSIPVRGLNYQHASTDLHLELGENAIHSMHYRLNHQGENLGELILRSDCHFDESQLTQLEALLPCLLFPLRNALLYRSVILDALRDPLTGAANRVAMDQTLSREIEMARRRGGLPFSLLMLDLDHFKSINDRHGHQGGDEVLKAVVACLKLQLRNMDMLFRFGGEEFLVLLSNTPLEAAGIVGNRLCEAVETLPFVYKGEAVPVSISIGCATYRFPESLDDLLRRADDALYQAKRNGRNQLRMAI